MRELAMPPPARTVQTLTRSVAALGAGSDRLLLLSREPGVERMAVTVPFVPGGTTREGAFGPLTDQRRHEIVPGGEPPDWRGVDLDAPRPLLFDGGALAFHEADPTTLRSLTRRTLPWDLIVPARDTRGEPTARETAALRARLKRAMQATAGTRAAGLAAVPKAWGGGASRAYLAALRVAGFPLVLVECQADEPSQCVVKRQCYLEGAAVLAPDAVAGIAVLPAERLVLIGDRVRHRIAAFRFDSCYHVPHVRDYLLPPRLKELTNLAVDAAGRLWVTTAMPDDYENANAYFWPNGEW